MPLVRRPAAAGCFAIVARIFRTGTAGRDSDLRIQGPRRDTATETFKNVYGGWQEVENSALALAETANLLMIPGRLCENGKPVPVQEETYRKAAEGLAAAGRAAYKAAQSKSMDAIVEVSDTVATCCSNCHEPYRDFDDQTRRCTPVDDRTE